ncbi:MAG: lysophospholipid acyltransferase family protein [Bacteroidales bacterium]|nr:lysophospholipid acyltransferase family protein [Bacteroidales bacterium]
MGELDYSSYGPAYRGFKVREDVFVPKPPELFSGTDPFTKMAPVRGQMRDISFDGDYPYLDRSFRFRFCHFICYLILWFVAFPVNRIKYGIRIEGRKNIRANRRLFRHGAMTVCNHVCRWDMISVLQAIRFREIWIPMYSKPFRGDDGWKMKFIGGLPIPENRAGLRAFNAAFDEIHAKGGWIHVFPESCSWKYYAPIRPFKAGAFNMAYKYSIPVIPTVISFRRRTGIFKLFGKDEPLLTIHVGEPIIPDKSTPRKEETARIRDLAHRSMTEMAGILNNPWPSALD